MMLRSGFLAFLGLLPAIGSAAQAQRLAPGERPASPAQDITVSIGARAGGKNYEASGPGSCEHAADASIRGASASLWLVQFAAAGKSKLRGLNLTLWRPKDGDSDQLSFSLETKSGLHRIETGGAEEAAGEGTVTILPSGPGGRLEINGKDADGKPIQVTIDCSAFADVASEGG
jgi:hypothetical protein